MKFPTKSYLSDGKGLTNISGVSTIYVFVETCRVTYLFGRELVVLLAYCILLCDVPGVCVGILDQIVSINGIYILFYSLARLYESTGRAIAVTPASALASASPLL